MNTTSRIHPRCSRRHLRLSAIPLFLLAGVLLFAGPALANVEPVVDSITPSTTVIEPGGVVFLQLDAHDPDCASVCTGGCGLYIRSDLLPIWTADGGTFENTDNGVDGSPFVSTTDWRAPMTEGTYNITGTVRDSGTWLCGGGLSGTLTIQIQVTLNPNNPPVVESLTADPTTLYPGESSNLTCVASDPDGDSLTYDWSADSGTLVPGALGEAVFTADSPGVVPVTCSVTDPSGAPASDTVRISVISVTAEKWLDRGLTYPRRLAADPTGTLFVLDGAASSIVAMNLFDGTVLYRIPADGVTSLDIDWNENLLVGLASGAQVWTRSGDTLLVLDSTSGDVIDVAADLANRRYGVLDRRSSQVTVYDETGAEVVAFGSNGDGADQCRTPHGLAATPAGGAWADTHWVVGDTGHGKIKVYNGAGALVSSFGDSGGGVGEFITLVDVEVGPDDVIYASDSFQSWIQTFNPDGTVRETLGEYGDGLGQFMTPTGLAVAAGYDRLIAASSNSARLQVFTTDRNPVVVGPAPAPALEPATLSYDLQELGTTSPSQAAVLRNDGGAPFGITAVEIEGDFEQTGTCGAHLDAGQSCSYEITFTPTAAGDRTGELRVGTTEGAEPLRVDLTGTGLQSPAITLAPASLLFPAQTVSTVSLPRDVTVTNLGPGPVSINATSVTPPYLQTHDCPAALAEGSACTVAVRFAPDAVGGSFPGTLTVDSTALNAPHTVSLDGSAVQVGIDVSDASVHEGDDQAVLAEFEVVLNGPSDGTVSVDYATADDTAVAGSDYESATGTLLFAQGEDRGTISVTILPDTLMEADEETFILTLSNPVGAALGDANAVGTILDNEVCAGPNLLKNPGAEAEAGGTGIPGWTEVTGYDWHPASGPVPPMEGGYYFYAGQTGAAQLEQMVDVSAFQDPILADDQEFEFEGYVRSGAELPADGARIVVEYLHAVSGLVLDSFDTGEIIDSSTWTRVHDVRTAPVDTGWIRVRLLATRYTGDSNDGLFDGLVLRSHRAAVLVVNDSTDYEGDAGGSYGMPFHVQLSCTYGEQVSLDYTTTPGTATEDLDYAYTAGGLNIPSGSTGGTVPVTIYGDGDDEDHETFFFNLANQLPPDVVMQDGIGLGTITNDDFCPQKPSYWIRHPAMWPVYSLAIGGVQYDQPEILDLLSYKGKDVASDVAREQAAAKLNLAEGSPPDIRPTVVEADEFLTQNPPGSDPSGSAASWGQELETNLAAYNSGRCP